MAQVTFAAESLLVKIGDKEYEIIFSKDSIIIRSDNPIVIVGKKSYRVVLPSIE